MLEEKVNTLERQQNPQMREREAAEARAKDQQIALLKAELTIQQQKNSSIEQLHENTIQALKTQNSLLSHEVRA